MLALRARYVLPVESPPIADGVVVLDGELVAELTSGMGPPGTIDLGNVVVLPGLVNAHTHLEFSRLAQPIGQAGLRFSDWIAAVVDWRRAVETTGPADWRQAAVRAGLQESVQAGVTTLADVITFPWPADAYRETASGVVALAEYLAPTEPRAGDQWALLRDFLSGWGPRTGKEQQQLPEIPRPEADASSPPVSEFAAERTTGGPRISWGISPHAPYTVRWEKLTEVCAWSAARQSLVAMHLAESLAELEFLRSGAGSLRDLLETLGAWDAAAAPRGRTPRDYLETLSAAQRSLVIHGNFLSPAEIRFAAACRDRMAVVYCPRTHSYFAHRRYPLAAMLSAGVRVALGTDSRASNPDLRLLEEMRHAAREHREVPPEVIVELATLSGAAALGQERRIGSLAPGKQADLVAIGLPASDNGPYAFLADSTCRIDCVYQAGKQRV